MTKRTHDARYLYHLRTALEFAGLCALLAALAAYRAKTRMVRALIDAAIARGDAEARRG